AAMVVQFGFAMMPLATASRAPGLTSLTTSGTSGSERQAEELSTTVTPAAANRSAWAREVAPPAENRAMSSPLGSASAASSTVMGCPLKSMVFPAERAEANSLRVPISNPGSSARRSSMTPPTWPVAPTTPILTLIVRYLRTPLLRCLHCRVRRRRGRPGPRRRAGLLIVADLVEADLGLHRVEGLQRLGAIGHGQGERDIRLARITGGDVLHDHVDIGLLLGQRVEDLSSLAGDIGNADDRDLGFRA